MFKKIPDPGLSHTDLKEELWKGRERSLPQGAILFPLKEPFSCEKSHSPARRAKVLFHCLDKNYSCQSPFVKILPLFAGAAGSWWCQGVEPHLQHANNEIMRSTRLPLNWGCCAWLEGSFHHLPGNSEAADMHVNGNVLLFWQCVFLSEFRVLNGRREATISHHLTLSRWLQRKFNLLHRYKMIFFS